MDYKEHTLVEKYSGVSTEDLLILLDLTNSLICNNKKSKLFFIGLLFYMIGPTILLFVLSFSLNSVLTFSIVYCTYFIWWKLFLEKRSYNTYEQAEYYLQREELEIALKYRFNNN